MTTAEIIHVIHMSLVYMKNSESSIRYFMPIYIIITVNTIKKLVMKNAFKGTPISKYCSRIPSSLILIIRYRSYLAK